MPRKDSPSPRPPLFTLAVLLVGVALAMILCGCGKGSAPAGKHDETQGARQAETTASGTTASEATTPTSVSSGVSREEQAAQSEADCRLVIYVADQSMGRKEARAFSELLADMIRTMASPSWTGGDLRNAALDHLAVPRYPECKDKK